MKVSVLTACTLVASSMLLTSCNFSIGTPAPANTNTNAEPANMLTLAKTTYSSNEAITLQYKTDATAKNAWIGIVPSSTPHGSEDGNDAVDVSYKYLDGSMSGSMSFNAPAKPGSYDLRLNENDSGGKELASVSFTVQADANAKIEPKITLGKDTYKPGEALSATFAAPSTLDKSAWIGVIPSATAHGTEDGNDAADVAYIYLDGKTAGSIDLKAPEQPGSYDLRLNENDMGGKELTSVTFKVQ